MAAATVKETWRSIRHANGRVLDGSYEVSTLGRARRRMADGRYRELRGAKHWRGYRVVSLYSIEREMFQVGISHLVWDAFGRGSRVGNHVHHKNGNRADNRLSNLELLSPTEHRREHSKLTMPDARKIRRMRSKGVKVRVVAAIFDISTSVVSQVANGLLWAEDSETA